VQTIDPAALHIAATFDACFARSHRTVLRLGGDEPLYLPPTAERMGVIVCNRDYPASALHEVAHWCIAARARRALVDYGYWYEPPPRPAAAQAQFLAAEARNQALESLFAATLGLPFEPSLDDPSADPSLRHAFAEDIRRAAAVLSARGLPRRAERFRAALATGSGHG
jgi:hypothetical protein